MSALCRWGHTHSFISAAHSTVCFCSPASVDDRYETPAHTPGFHLSDGNNFHSRLQWLAV